MIAAERQQRILEEVRRDGVARVADLARKFRVTAETVRRDLEKLEADGLLVRRHGGATTTDFGRNDPPFAERRDHLTDEKASIVWEAVRRIEEGDTLFLDGSTTVLQMAALIPDMPLTIITNSYHAVGELSRRGQVTAILLGGLLDAASMCFVGPTVEAQLRTYSVDKAFLSCRGVHPRFGATDGNELQASIKQIMMAQARARFLLADSSKIGNRALVRICGLKDFDEIITDGQLDGTTRRLVRGACRRLVIASAAGV